MMASGGSLTALLLLVAAAAHVSARVLYTQPSAQNLSAIQVLADPPSGHGPQPGRTAIVFWRIAPQSSLTTADWQVGTQTGLMLDPATWKLPSQLGLPSTTRPVPGRDTASSVQWTPGKPEYGCYLDTVHNPAVNNTRLSTIVVSHDWADEDVVFPWRPTTQTTNPHWSSTSSARLRFRADLEVHAAQKLSDSAIYITMSFGIKHYDPKSGRADRFLWYETTFFDLDRGFTEWVKVDSFSREPIVHAVLLPGVKSRYHTQAANSAFSSNTTWVGYRTFDFSVSADEFGRSLADINQQFPQYALPTNVAEYGVAHFNVENEGLANAACGFRLANLTIELEEG